jgi:DNA replication protein DnaC
VNGEPDRLSKNLDRLMDKIGVEPGRVDDLFPDEALMLGVHTVEDVARARWQRVIPQRFTRACLADLDESIRGDVTEWGHNAQGRNLVLFGAVGTGKTHAAVAALRAPSWRGLDIEFVPAVEMFDRLRPGGDEDALDVLCEVDRLVIDDLGAERPTDWTAERLYLVVNRRWLDERPTVVTTNLDPREFEVEIGPRMFSRLVGNDAMTLRLTGPDRRRRR